MTSTVEPGDVYICLFPFTDGRTTKARPVLILLDLGSDCLVSRITSVPPIAPWRNSGAA